MYLCDGKPPVMAGSQHKGKSCEALIICLLLAWKKMLVTQSTCRCFDTPCLSDDVVMWFFFIYQVRYAGKSILAYEVCIVLMVGRRCRTHLQTIYIIMVCWTGFDSCGTKINYCYVIQHKVSLMQYTQPYVSVNHIHIEEIYWKQAENFKKTL